MFKIPMHNFHYDADRTSLDLPHNAELKKLTRKIYTYLREDFIIDFTSVDSKEQQKLQEIRDILHSPLNNNSRVIYHLINYYNINVRRSNKEEENNMLHLLCACGRKQDVEWYLREFPKVKVNTVNHIMQSPIQFAIAIGNSPEIATYLYSTHKAALAPLPSKLSNEQDDYTVVDALFIQWLQNDRDFFSTWEHFGNLICYDKTIADLVQNQLPQFYSFLRSDMILK